MSTMAVLPEPQQAMPPKGQDPTIDDQNQGTPDQNRDAVQLTDAEQKAMIQMVRDYELSWNPQRRAITKRVMRAFETLKGNANLSYDPEQGWYDPIEAALSTGADPEDLGLYNYNTNLYGMLHRSYKAALSPETPKTRYMPEDADEEVDISTSAKASKVQAIVERKNNIRGLQKSELTHFWTGGCYFVYNRYVVDSGLAGMTNQPVTEMVDQPVTPDRFICPKCGQVTPAEEVGPWTKPTCKACGYQFGEEDFHQGESIPMPTEVGKVEVPNGMVLMSVFGAANVDCDPDAQEIRETPILDLRVEADVAAIRAAYPAAYDKLKSQQGTGGDASAESDRMVRQQLTMPVGTRGRGNYKKLTYSRCWIQPWAFYSMDDRDMAESLRAKFPDGCKLVQAAGEFLDAVPEKLMDTWTHCASQGEMGLYPPGVGDAALDIQARINDVANITHEHMDRNASPTVLYDADAIDGDAMNGKPMTPGSLTPIKRKGALAGKPLSDLMFQPQFHVDANIYSYGENLIQLAQLVSGVMPQIFGGTQKGVETAQGQEQQLNTAMAQLGLYWDQIREEHAVRSEIAVKCFIKNMDERVRSVIDCDGGEGYENEWILLTEMQGSFHTYPETDQGFPATYAEIRDRIMALMQEVGTSPAAQQFFDDPDNMKTAMRYIGVPDMKIPGDAERTKIKRVIGELAKGQPFEMPPEGAAQLGIPAQGPTMLPQNEAGLMMPDPDFDDMGMIVDLCKQWGCQNWKMRETNPAGFENVRAYLRIAAQFMQKQQLAQGMAQAAAQGPQGSGQKQLPPGA